MSFKNKILLIIVFLFNATLIAQEYIYHEEYDAINGWPEVSESDRSLNVYNGRYYIEYKLDTDYYGISTRDFDIDFNRDFELETSIQKISGVENMAISFFYDYKDLTNYKEFAFSPTGYYRVAKSVNDVYTTQQAWTVSSAVKKGIYSTNILKVVKKGNTLKYYVNDTFLYEMDYDSFIGQKIGIRIYKNQRISVDYIRVKYNSSVIVNNNNSGNSVVFDSFDNNGNSWSTSNSNDANLQIVGGKYYFEHKKETGGWTSTTDFPFDATRDFRIETKILKVDGVIDYGYGIIWGRKDGDDQNRFFIASNGLFSIDNYVNGVNKKEKPWAASSYLNQNNNASNTLTIEKIGNQVKYYINDNNVFTQNYTPIKGHRAGFVVYGKQKVAFEYFSISYLNSNNNNIVNNINTNSKLSEEFSDNSGNWAISNTTDARLAVNNGKYYFENKLTESGYNSTNVFNIDENKNFEIEAKIDKIMGVSNYSYGLLWGKGTKTAFRFFITSNGYYKISRLVDNEEQVIVKFTASSFLNEGNGSSNILKISKKGDSFNYYINGNFVTKTDAEPLGGDRFGFEVFNQQEIAIDYLRVSQSDNVIVNKKTILKAPLNEDFNSNKNDWNISSTTDYTGVITNGKMYLDRITKGGIFVSNDIEIDDTKDFIIETSLAKERDDNGLYGITFGRKNSANEYSLLFSNGSYMFRKFENDVYTKIIEFTDTDLIKEGVGEVNKIKIIKSGGLLRFYINDQYVNETPFQPFFGNKFGYSVYFNQKISIDFLNVKYQSESYNTPPVVVISEPLVEETRGFKIVKASDILVKGIATDADGIYSVNINGVEAMVKEGGVFTANVPLKYGKNKLIVTATDLKKLSSSKTFTIKRDSPVIVNPIVNKNKKDENLDIGFGEYYALLIGVSEYGDSAIADLEGLPKKDAKDLADILESKYNFKKENIIILNNSPTANDIIKEFTVLKKKINKNDNLLIFYAGHGIYDEINEIGSWLPSDADMTYELNLISNSQVVDYLKSIHSKHTLLISDACFSGSIFKSRSFTKAPKSVQMKYELPSRKAITSGTLKTVPNKSVFLKFLLQRLTENKDKYISARQLFDRIEEPVMNTGKNTPQYGTIYGVGDEGGDFIFIQK